MSITKKDVEHTAELARLSLEDKEKEKLTADLTKILDYINQLQKIDISGVDLNLAEGHPVNQAREDLPQDSGIQEELLNQAPKKRERHFEVKGVFE